MKALIEVHAESQIIRAFRLLLYRQRGYSDAVPDWIEENASPSWQDGQTLKPILRRLQLILFAASSSCLCRGRPHAELQAECSRRFCEGFRQVLEILPGSMDPWSGRIVGRAKSGFVRAPHWVHQMN